MKAFLKPLLWGVFLGVAAVFSPGGVFVLLLAVGGSLALRRFGPPEDRAFLVRLFLVAFLLRVGLSLCLDVVSWKVEGRLPTRWGPPRVWDLGAIDQSRKFLRLGDSDYYSERGYALAHYAAGNRAFTVLQRITRYGDHAYLQVIGWFYYTFGFSPFSMKWLNGWFGALHVIALFFLAKRCFQSRIARWAGGLAAGFPTLLVWSSSNLKDPLLYLLITLLLLLFTTFRTAARLKHRIAFLAVFGAIFWVTRSFRREEWSLVLVACLVGIGILEWCIRKRQYALLLFSVIALMALHPAEKVQAALRMAVYRHMGYYHTDSMTYRYLPDRFYDPSIEDPKRDAKLPGAAIRGIPTALKHYFFEPFPSRTVSGSALFMIPQMLIWYFLLPFALIGAAAGIRWNTWNCAFLAALLLIWIPMGAMAIGNVGILTRMRDMTTPFILIFSAAGFWIFARGRQGFSGEVLHHVAG